MKKECGKCGACCSDVSVEIDKPKTKEDWDYIKWYVAHKNINVYLDDEKEWCVEFLTPCSYLTPKGCNIYNNRFVICSEHDPDDCMKNGKGDYYFVRFTCPEDVDKYLAKRKKK